jgi:hypothetical protein
MIDIASRATHSIKIPGRKGARKEIIRTFKNHLTQLKKKLNVSLTVSNVCFYLIHIVEQFCQRND